ncbi:MAG: endonuclease/exonuclease/phosphatase family protein [Acidobacteriota bacterium]
MRLRATRQALRLLRPLLAAVVVSLLGGCTEPELGPAAVQGAGHVSPYVGRTVAVRGIVTGGAPALNDAKPGGFWIQSAEGDGDDATSEALFIVDDAQEMSVEPGDDVRIRGRVVEVGHAEDLRITSLEPIEIETLARGLELPAPVALVGREAGGDGASDGVRVVPTTIEDDGLERFEPERDALDFFESLEGQRVAIHDARVVGPTNKYDVLVVQPGDVAQQGDLAPTSDDARDALLPESPDPRSLRLSPRRLDSMPPLDRGASFDEPIVGLVDYEYGAYRILPLELPRAARARTPRATTSLVRGPEQLTVASFNVLNLAATDPAKKFDALARIVVESLRSPDVLALQEVQDDSGPEDDGVTSAGRTLTRLADAIERAGGPAYAFRQIDPRDGADGGRPGANIRVAFLFDADRVQAVDRRGDPMNPSIEDQNGELALYPSPARLLDPAFDEDPARDWSGTRKPLVGHFRFADHDLFAIALHLRSKGADDRAMGPVQPPRRHSEEQRVRQAEAVRDFVERLYAVDPQAHVLVLGDLNEYPGRPPLDVLRGTPLIDPATSLPPAERFTFNFEGLTQQLDYILLSPSLAATAPELDIVHTSSPRAAARQASDHDPLVVRLTLP